MRARAIVLGAALAIALALRASAQTPPAMEFVFEEVASLAAPIPVGKTAMGERIIIPITGGTFAGPNIRGTIVPGGWDWQLRRADGCLDLQADYMLKTDDGVVINVINKGQVCDGADGQPRPTRTRAVFEPPLGKYAWLGQSVFVGTLEEVTRGASPSVRIRFFRVK